MATEYFNEMLCEEPDDVQVAVLKYGKECRDKAIAQLERVKGMTHILVEFSYPGITTFASEVKRLNTLTKAARFFEAHY